MIRRFLWIYAATAIVLALPFALNGLYLWRAHEFDNPAKVVQSLISDNGLYGTAINANTPDIKLALVREIRPDIVALGSSRALQFRQQFFDAAFVNAGGVMGELVDAENFLRLMYEFHTPELLILQLDHWWFFETPFARQARPIQGQDAQARITFDKLVKPSRWLADGSITPKQYVRGLIATADRSSWIGYRPFGVQAAMIGRGFRRDGSYLDARAWYGMAPDFPSTRFAQIASHIREEEGNWVSVRTADAGMIEYLHQILSNARGQGSAVIVFLAPLPESILRLIAETGGIESLAAVRSALRQALLDFEFYDLLDPAEFGGTDCEYLNGDHGGDVTYARLLLAMLRMKTGSALAGFVDEARLQDMINQNAGLSLIKFDPSLYAYEETDYLGLGCAKQIGRSAQR